VDVAQGTGGFVIQGEDANDSAGYSVASAGDVNGDGFDDLIVGASGADGAGNAKNVAGAAYVVFGSAFGAAAELSIAALDAVRAEGDAGSTAFTFTVTRGGVVAIAASATVTISGADAADFVGGTLPVEGGPISGHLHAIRRRLQSPTIQRRTWL